MTESKPLIRLATKDDAPVIAEIYNYYIRETTVTFEETPVTPEKIAIRLEGILASYPWTVYELDGRIEGYAYAGPYHSRCSYRHTVEITIYLRNEVGGKGIGTALYEDLFARLDKLPIHAIIGAIALPNPASVAIHEKFGMEQVGHFKEVGRKFDQWLDVGYWEKILQKEANLISED